MSTLTSSISPAASPRAPGYSTFGVHSRAARSPRVLLASSSDLSACNHTGSAASVGVQSVTLTSPPRQSASSYQYIDAGTQYSPEGSPPTARGVGGHSARQRFKRKQESDSEPPPPPKHTNSLTANEVTAASASSSGPAAGSGTTGEIEKGAEGTRITDNKQTALVNPHGPSTKDCPQQLGSDSGGCKIMPRQYEKCDPMDLGIMIADMLMELIRLNDKIPIKDGKLTRFHSRAPPGISTHDYLRRLIQHATLSPPILLSMVFYIDRLCNMYPAFTIGSLTVHRFLITAATVASKGLSDSFWTNPTYARIGGISTGELATLELDFLERVDFKIVPKPETLVEYYNSLVQRSKDCRLEADQAAASPEPDIMEVEPT